MTTFDEIDMLMEILTAAWGSVSIACYDGMCAVSDGGQRVYTAPTLVEALRLAAQATATEGAAAP